MKHDAAWKKMCDINVLSVCLLTLQCVCVLDDKLIGQ